MYPRLEVLPVIQKNVVSQRGRRDGRMCQRRETEPRFMQTLRDPFVLDFIEHKLYMDEF